MIYERIEERVKDLERRSLNLNYWQRSQRRKDFRQWLETDEQAECAHRFWQLKFVTESSPRTVIVRFSPWLIPTRTELASALLSELARGLGERLGNEVRHAFAALLQRFADMAPVAGTALDLATGTGGGRLLSAGVTWSRNSAAKMATGPTLDQLKSQLNSILSRLVDRRIVVVIDDLDRLVPSEALEMVSLVKSLGDLPNVIYILAYEEKKLAELIGRATSIDGANFLEKIIQYPVHLPMASGADLLRLLNADVGVVLGDLSTSQQRRLDSTWHYVFRHYLRTPRDVRRYVNAIKVSASVLRGYVDLVDLIILELLRVFEPDVYWWVREHIDELTS